MLANIHLTLVQGVIHVAVKFVHQIRTPKEQHGGNETRSVADDNEIRSVADILGCDKIGADAVRAVTSTSLETYFKATLWVSVLFLLLTYQQLWTIWTRNGSDMKKIQYYLLDTPVKIIQELFYPIVQKFVKYGVLFPGVLVLLTQLIFLDFWTGPSSTVKSMCALYLCLTGNCDKQSNPIMCLPDVLKVADMMFTENCLFYLMFVFVLVYHYVIAIDMIA